MAEEKGQSAAAAAAAQVQAIVEAAERSAEQIRAEAERDAGETRAAVARLAERAAELERRLEQLASGVRDAIEALRAELATASGRPEAPPVAEDPASRTDPEADDERIAEAIPDGARVLALKMALDGRPREETASYLRENFELDDPQALLDEVYARVRS